MNAAIKKFDEMLALLHDDDGVMRDEIAANIHHAKSKTTA